MYENRILMDEGTVEAFTSEELLSVEVVIRTANAIDVRAGQHWGVRRIMDWEHILVLVGCLRYRSGGRAAAVGGGDVLTIPPGEDHFLETIEAGEISCIHAEYYLVDGRDRVPVRRRLYPRVLRDADRADLTRHFLRVVDAYEGGEVYRAATLRALGNGLGVELTRLAAATPRLSSRTRRMMHHIRQHAGRAIPRSELARMFGISAQHVNVIFRREVGMTPSQYQHRVRMQQAHHLLSHDGLRVGEAAEVLGYYDSFHFSRVFKQAFGYPPSRLLQPRP